MPTGGNLTMKVTTLGVVAGVSLNAFTRTNAAGPSADDPVVRGLDHVPVAVASLEEAAERYRALGFTLKPGRPHDNGVRNHHAKFADGTEIELITAPEARDALTATYRRHLGQGDGPAFLALYAPSMEAAGARLVAARVAHNHHRSYLGFGDGDGLSYLFLGPRNHSSTDRPDHFAHANGASSLVAVWLAGEDLSSERRLLTALGAELVTAEVRVPDAVSAPVARFAEGDVVLLPKERQLVPGRRIVGATLRVRSLVALESLLARRGAPVPTKITGRQGRSVFLPPAVTHGLWLEFRESR
jgi:catechol 2,3-dioxygenase-like lactoylglutathione lyase family enzyme